MFYKLFDSVPLFSQLFTELAPVHQLVEQYGGSACSSSIDKDSILSVCLSLTTPVAVSRMQLSAGVQVSEATSDYAWFLCRRSNDECCTCDISYHCVSQW